MCRVFNIVVLVFLFASPAWAWTEGSCATGASSTVASFQPNSPTGSPNNGDLLLVVVSVTKSGTAVANLSESGGSGTWTDAIPGTTSFNGGDGKIIASVGTWENSGFTMPTFALASSTGIFSYTACAFNGFSGVEKETTQTTATSATVNFAAETPNEANAEAVFVGAISVGAGAGSWSSNNFLTSCSKNDDLILEGAHTGSQTIIGMYDVNMGPCAAATTGTPSVTYSGTAENNIGLTLILTPANIPLPKTALMSPPVLNSRGAAYFLSGPPNVVDPAMFSAYTDILAYYTSWTALEPNSCDEYAWDVLDNLILLAREHGEKIALGIKTNNFTPCGVTGAAACGFVSGSNIPAWMVPSGNGGQGTSNTACDNNHTMVKNTDFLQSIWIKGFAAPAGNANFIFDPANTAYRFAWDRFITDMGARYGAVTSIVEVKDNAYDRDTIEWAMDIGANGSTVACGGNSTQCTAICGSGTCNVTIGDATHWLAFTPQGGGTYGTGNGTGDSTTCSGSSQPFGVCDLERSWEHFEASWHTAFPHAALANSADANGNNIVPEGTIVGGSFPGGMADPFAQDIFAHDATTYTGIIKEENGGLAVGSGHCRSSQFLLTTNQPLVGLGYQTATELSNVAGGACNTGTLYSLSATDCLIPCIYYGPTVMMNPYFEFYPADWDSVPDEPWIKLVHDFAWGL